jgi:hypothetical protein
MAAFALECGNSLPLLLGAALTRRKTLPAARHPSKKAAMNRRTP